MSIRERMEQAQAEREKARKEAEERRAADHLTLRKLFARFEKQGHTLEQMLDIPIMVMVSDAFANFEIITILDDYPNLRMPEKIEDTQYLGQMRFAAYLHGKALREVKKS